MLMSLISVLIRKHNSVFYLKLFTSKEVIQLWCCCHSYEQFSLLQIHWVTWTNTTNSLFYCFKYYPTTSQNWFLYYLIGIFHLSLTSVSPYTKTITKYNIYYIFSNWILWNLKIPLEWNNVYFTGKKVRKVWQLEWIWAYSINISLARSLTPTHTNPPFSLSHSPQSRE